MESYTMLNQESISTFETAMFFDKIDLRDAGSFSSLFLDYIDGKEELKSFYGLTPTKENFIEQIKRKNFDHAQRLALHESLTHQYGALEKSASVFNNIYSLQNENTYTVCTGHQLNIFTGPLYVIYKIISVINICKKLREEYPAYNFVPVYWMASEDHDFEEIASFNLFGKKHVWNTEQRGAVGRFRPQALNELLEMLPERVPLFEEAYLDHNTLAGSVRNYMNELFGQEGLVVVDGDDAILKKTFSSTMIDDLFKNHAKEIVDKTSSRLGQAGYKAVAYPREINFFFLNGMLRERIVKEGDLYKVLNSELVFTERELLDEIHDHPERFSPNVILRPLYQESVLPNVAYVGGPGEISYWLQFKDMFEYFGEAFPILMPRNFGMVVPKTITKKIKKLGLQTSDLFKPIDELKKAYLAGQHLNGDLFDIEKGVLREILHKIAEKVIAVDGSLKGFTAAEINKVDKVIMNLEKRVSKSHEANNEMAMNQLQSIKGKLFPEGHLQERHDNFLNFYFNDHKFIGDLLKRLDPFDFTFDVMYYE